ncbi:MAG: hypothetical protein WCH21_05355 [Bacteroidota bacterium]
MARKAFKAIDHKLYIITSLGGVIFAKLVDKKTKEILEEKTFLNIGNDLEDYLETLEGFDTNKILNYLNNI